MNASQSGDMTMWVAIQPDGSRLRYEDWVVRMWRYGQLTDSFLLAGLRSAVEVRPAYLF
jgi:hypothetical protein